MKVAGRDGAQDEPLMQRDEPGARPLPAADLVTLGGRMLAVGETEAALFLSFRDAYARAGRDVAARPDDAGFRRMRGELCLTAGLHEPGRLEEAVRNWRRRWSWPPRAARPRAWPSAGRRCARPTPTWPSGPPRPAGAPICWPAVAVAGEPRQRAETRLRLAEECESDGDHRRAAELAVETIALAGDAALGDPERRRRPPAGRTAAWSDPAAAWATGRQAATQFLQGLITRRGPAAYETCEAMAAERFAAAHAEQRRRISGGRARRIPILPHRR